MRVSGLCAADVSLPTRAELERLVLQKYGNDSGEVTGPGLRLRSRFGYYLPGDVYEALIGRLVYRGCSWLDVGGGHHVFPNNPKLARELTSRCASVVAVDPSANVHDNAFVHERIQSPIQAYHPARQYDLATLRMVVEHVDQPAAIARALHDLLFPGGLAVVLTVNRASPISLISRAVPFRLHAPIKSVFWGGQDRDTFPVRYRMNSRKALRSVFTASGFEEAAFAYLDDLSTWIFHPRLHYAELQSWRLFRALGLPYPENCLIGIYRKCLSA
jgi:SAM-dependent methyltransferase